MNANITLQASRYYIMSMKSEYLNSLIEIRYIPLYSVNRTVQIDGYHVTDSNIAHLNTRCVYSMKYRVERCDTRTIFLK